MISEAILLGGMTTLAGVVVYLFRLVVLHHVAMEKRWVECDADRKRLWKRLVEIELGIAHRRPT